MRRNITISLDDDFVPVMDRARRGKPRGRWIEDLAIRRRVAGFGRSPTTGATTRGVPSSPLTLRKVKPELEPPN
jgi:hypothetical protein